MGCETCIANLNTYLLRSFYAMKWRGHTVRLRKCWLSFASICRRRRNLSASLRRNSMNRIFEKSPKRLATAFRWLLMLMYSSLRKELCDFSFAENMMHLKQSWCCRKWSHFSLLVYPLGKNLLEKTTTMNDQMTVSCRIGTGCLFRESAQAEVRLYALRREHKAPVDVVGLH